MLTGIVPDDELPELNTPLVTSGANWIYCPGPVSAKTQLDYSYIRPRSFDTHKAARVIASCAEKYLE